MEMATAVGSFARHLGLAALLVATMALGSEAAAESGEIRIAPEYSDLERRYTEDIPRYSNILLVNHAQGRPLDFEMLDHTIDAVFEQNNLRAAYLKLLESGEMNGDAARELEARLTEEGRLLDNPKVLVVLHQMKQAIKSPSRTTIAMLEKTSKIVSGRTEEEAHQAYLKVLNGKANARESGNGQTTWQRVKKKLSRK